MNQDVSIIESNEGRFLGVSGGNYRVIISGERTDNKFSVIEMLVPPGGGPPPHSHPGIQETFYVLDGEIEFKTEKGATVVKTGGFVNIPLGGAIHCFKNTSKAMAKLLCTVNPSGLEKIFDAIGAPAAPGEFLPAPELTEERKKMMKEIDQTYHQKTYPENYLD